MSKNRKRERDFPATSIDPGPETRHAPARTRFHMATELYEAGRLTEVPELTRALSMRALHIMAREPPETIES